MYQQTSIKNMDKEIKTNDTFTKSIQELIDAIQSNETVVFCGAGISIHSGLPSANNLIWYVLGELGISEREVNIIINSELPFEAFIDTLREYSNIISLLNIFDVGSPNTNHILLSKLAKAGYLKTICTTNFDQLIEKAFIQEGLVEERDYQVFYNEKEFDRIDWNDCKIKLIKLHGSSVDKDNMSITLHQVSIKALLEQRQRIIEHIFSKGLHKNVLIFGYSCSDLFDISPHIESILTNHKKVLFIDHYPMPENQDKKDGEIEDIKIKNKKNPFKNYEGSKRIFYNTDKLVRSIWTSFIDEKYDLIRDSDNTLWKNYVNDWANAFEKRPIRRYLISGLIFYEISEFNKAITFFEESLKLSKECRDREGEGFSLGNLGNTYRSKGEFQTAIEYDEKALQISRELGDKQGEGIFLGNIGLDYRSLGENLEAIRYHEKALKITREIGDKKGEGDHIHNLGIAYYEIGEYQKAIRYHKKGLQISRDIGDKNGEGNSLCSLGITCRQLGDYQNAIEYLEKALRIAQEVGNKKMEGIYVGHLGNVYNNICKYQKAVECHEKNLELSIRIGDKEGEGSSSCNLGISYFHLGKPQKAMKHYERALMIAKEIGAKRWIANCFGNIGVVYCDGFSEYEKALEYYEKALNLSIKIGAKQEEGNQLFNMGIAYGRLNDLNNAKEYLEKALSIYRTILGEDHHSTKEAKRYLAILHRSL